jgi:hypothetical protein
MIFCRTNRLPPFLREAKLAFVLPLAFPYPGTIFRFRAKIDDAAVVGRVSFARRWGGGGRGRPCACPWAATRAAPTRNLSPVPGRKSARARRWSGLPRQALSLYHIFLSFPRDKISFAQAPAFPPRLAGEGGPAGPGEGAVPIRNSECVIEHRSVSQFRITHPEFRINCPPPPPSGGGESKRLCEGKPCLLEMTGKCDREIAPSGGKQAAARRKAWSLRFRRRSVSYSRS